jgi:hypothetical protein
MITLCDDTQADIHLLGHAKKSPPAEINTPAD